MMHNDDCFSCGREPAEVDAHIDQVIDGAGHIVMGIQADPPFAYTAGLWEKGMPELIMFGLSGPTSMAILNRVVDHIKTNGMIQDGDLLDDIATMPTKIGAVHDRHVVEHFKVAFERIERVKAEVAAPYALQIIWPDTQGRFPGDPLFEDRFSARQPLLNG